MKTNLFLSKHNIFAEVNVKIGTVIALAAGDSAKKQEKQKNEEQECICKMHVFLAKMSWGCQRKPIVHLKRKKILKTKKNNVRKAVGSVNWQYATTKLDIQLYTEI